MQFCSKFRYLTLLIALLCSIHLWAQPITIGTGGDFTTLSDAESSLVPGDTVIILNQLFNDGTQFLVNVSGTSSDPIVIMAQTTHGPVFQGGTEGIHLVNCNYLEIIGLVFDGQTGNGFNADDGGDYATPSTFLTFRDCIFRNIAQSGNHDLLKLSGVDNFLVTNCLFQNGNDGGAGIDMVGCHQSIIEDCVFDNCGVTGIQAKGGSEFILIRRNTFQNISQRAINAGGSTGLQFFRPPLPPNFMDAFEAANIDIYANVFIGNWAPIAYVTAENVRVRNNTFYAPENWVMRILQETTNPGFISCQNNEFSNNIVYLPSDLTEVNIGPGTLPETFTMTNNLWYNASSNSWSPNLPVTDPNQIIDDPDFVDAGNGNFEIQLGSPAIGMGFPFGDPATDFLNLPFHNPPAIGAFSFDAIPLAIDDYSLKIEAMNDGVHIEWKSSQAPFPNMKVERSIHSFEWETIGYGQTDTHTGRGRFIDTNPQKGVNYYRLGEETGQGNLEYSQILIAHWSLNITTSSLTFPNPVTTKLYIDLSGLPINPNMTTLEFFDMNLRRIYLKYAITDKLVEVQTAELLPGQYILVVKSQGTKMTRMFSKANW